MSTPLPPSNSFQITIRSRPLLEALEDEEAWSVDTTNNTISSIYRSPSQFLQDPSHSENVNYIKRRYADVNYNYIFKFDQVFDYKNTTEDLYKQRCRDIVYSFMTGVNGTIFTYGQTMSGKTFTMLGAINNPGILPFALLDIFEEIEKVFCLFISSFIFIDLVYFIVYRKEEKIGRSRQFYHTLRFIMKQ